MDTQNNMIRVVIADASETLRLTLKDEIEAVGTFTVVGSTGDGREALRLVEQEKPQLLLTELLLPGLDGFGLLNRIAKLDAKPRTIILSVAFRSDIAAKAMEMDVAFFMPKPFDMDSLLAQMRQLADIGNLPQGAESAARNETPGSKLVMMPQKSSHETQQQHPSDLQRVTAIIREIGIPAHIRGYQFVRESILLAAKDPTLAGAVTKMLYPEVARRYGTTPSRVERGIRHGIDIAWDRGNEDLLRKYFFYKPTNSEFIATLGDMLRLESEQSAS